jgi:hypothetical protein
MRMSSQTVLLDVVVNTAKMYTEIGAQDRSVSLVVAADELRQPFSTPPAMPAKRVTWQYPFRLALNEIDIATSYLSSTMCKCGVARDIVPIGRCRIAVGAMPRRNAKMIRFPLLDGAQQVCTMRCCAAPSLVRTAQQGRGEWHPAD